MKSILMCTALTFLIGPSLAMAQPNAALDVYAKPAERVDIGNGRHLNLRCTGEGKPTVILESGAIADSLDWFKVQPKVAQFTTVCSYDRAGYGFSDGGAAKDYIAGSADDLRALIRAAHIATPVVLVGHSLGSDIARNFADRYASDVAALVLIDPPPQDIGGVSAAQRKEHDESAAGRTAMIASCKNGAAKLNDEPLPPELQNCLRPPDPNYSAQLNAARRAAKTNPAFWDSVGSALNAGAALDTKPVPATENHGSLMVLILQPDSPFEDVPPSERAMLEKARQRTQRQIAKTSKHGEIIPVAHSTHDVQIDRPDAVVEAIRKAATGTSR